MSSWSVDIYYSGFATVEVEAADECEAIIKGREETSRRLHLAIIMDPDGAATQLAQSLETWKECDTAKGLG